MGNVAYDVDWNEVKTEYITTNTSYRKLAKKYGVSSVAVSNKGCKENWVELRQQHINDTLAKAIKGNEKQQADRLKRICDVSDKFLKIIEETVDQIEPDQVICNPQTIKQLVGAIKDLKDIQNIKSELDIREQRARIDNLERQAKDSSNDSHNITVTIAGGDESWAK